MEIKTLVYILAAIIWLVYNARESIRKSKKMMRPAPVVTPEKARKKTVPGLKPVPAQASASLKKPISSSKHRDNNYLQPKFISHPEIEIPRPEVSNDDEATLNGFENTDWRKAVVLAELLRPAYLK